MVPSYPTDHLCMDFQCHLCLFRISSAFHHDCAADSMGFWGGYLYPEVHMSLENNPVLEHLRKGSGTEALCSGRFVLGTEHSSETALPALPSSGPWTSWAASWASTLTPLTPLQALGKSEVAQVEMRAAFALQKHFMCEPSSSSFQKGATEILLKPILLQNPGSYRKLLNQV